MKSALIKYAENVPIPLLIFTSIISTYTPIGEWANDSRLLGGTDIGLALFFGFTALATLVLSLLLSLVSLILAITYKLSNIEGVNYLIVSFLIGLAPIVYAKVFGFMGSAL